MEKEKAATEKNLEIPSEIKGVILTVEQKTALAKGEKVSISGMQRKGGGTFSALVSWDLEKAKPHYDFPEKPEQAQEFRMPNKVKGVELSEENKQKLAAGEKVFLTGMTAVSGKLFDAHVYVDTENKKLAFDFPESPRQAQEFRMPNAVKGVELSEENKHKLEAGERIYLEGMTSAKGTLFSANIYVDKEKGTLAFDFPEKKENKQEQKEALCEAPLAKPIKKNVVKM